MKESEDTVMEGLMREGIKMLKRLADAAHAVIEQWDEEGGSYPDKGEYPLDDKIEHLREVLGDHTPRGTNNGKS